MEYIGRDEDDRCIFCTLPRDGERLRENLVLARGRHAYVILNKYPYNNGHLLVVPFRHIAEFPALSAEEHVEIAHLVARSVEALRAEYEPDGFNLGMNLGRAGGAGIAGHLHQHVVPRWTGDTNFLPVLASTKSLPEHVLRTWDRLRPHLAPEDRGGDTA
jgi:ATP adenylyltransferase